MEQGTEVVYKIFIHSMLKALVAYCKQYKIYVAA